MGNLGHFLERLKECGARVRASGLKEAMVLHHDEADGLTSAALTKLSLESLGLNTRLICLDKLHPEVVDEVESGPRRLLAYSDIGSGHIDSLSRSNKTGSLIVVLDHHDTVESTDPLVYNLNPELDGFSGERDASSATVAYFFARTVDENLRRFSHLTLIGSMEVPGEPRGLNALASKDALEEKVAMKTEKGDFKIELGGRSISRHKIVTILNALGSVGYYQNGPMKGVTACLQGLNEESVKLALHLEEKRKAANKKVLAEMRQGGLFQKTSVQWFHAHDTYSGMSGKVVGSFCSYLRFQRLVNPMKYLVGMMNVPAEIPGWGKLPAPMVKVSGRAPQTLARLIEKGERPSLSKTLSDACLKVGGFGDGHSVAASGVFPVGREEQFLELFDGFAASYRASSTIV